MPADAPVRFAPYRSAVVHGAKIDWDTPVEITDAIRRGVYPQDPARFRVGRLKRAFRVEATTSHGQRTRKLGNAARTETVTHQKGALVFSLDDAFFLVELPNADELG